MKRLSPPAKSRKGQTLVEYALILAFISLVAVSIMITLGTAIHGLYTSITSNITSGISSAESSH